MKKQLILFLSLLLFVPISGYAGDEVVVTALGIKRERKALGYSLGEVKGEDLVKAKETSVINSLAGKIPRLVISQTAGGPSGSTRVIVRGSTEMTGNNQPLYVVDGVPLDNTTTFEQQLTKWDDIQYAYGQGTSGRINGTDDQYSSCKTLVDKLKDYADPRLSIYAEPNIEGEYVGYPNGTKAYAIVSNFSKIGKRFMRDLTGFSPWFRTSETYFSYVK